MPSGFQRDNRLDALRGFLLAAMTFNHFAGPLRAYTYEPLGYFSWAEGFVVLSAYVYALVYYRHLDAPDFVKRKSYRRALTIYWHHAAVAVVVLYLLPRLIARAPFPFWHELPSLKAHSIADVGYSLLFLFQPIYLDVLPLYVVFLLIAPWALLAVKHRRIWLLAAASTVVWCLGQQVHPVQAVAESLGVMARPGYFNPFVWQSLWIIGLCIGFSVRDAECTSDKRSAWSARAVYVLASTGVLLFCCRHGFLELPQELGFLVDRKTLGPVRLLNALCVIAAVGLLLRWCPRERGIPGLTFLGQHSLQVFSFHLLVIYSVGPYTGANAGATAAAGSLIPALAAVVSLFIPAVLHWKWQRRSGEGADTKTFKNKN